MADTRSRAHEGSHRIECKSIAIIWGVKIWSGKRDLLTGRHSVAGPQGAHRIECKSIAIIWGVKIWSGKRDSNSRPRPWQGRALPTELFPHRVDADASF